MKEDSELITFSELKERVYEGIRKGPKFLSRADQKFVLNQIIDSDNRVINRSDYMAYTMYLKPTFLNIMNMYKLLSWRGELVSTPEEADVVFDNSYVPAENNQNQQVIKSTQIEKMVSFLNK